jgi:hypothetical protein
MMIMRTTISMNEEHIHHREIVSLLLVAILQNSHTVVSILT